MATTMLPAEECQLRLNEISAQFMRDEITAQDFEDAKKQYMPDYRLAMQALGKSLYESESTSPDIQEREAAYSSGITELMGLFLAILVMILGLLHIGHLADRFD